jgi:CRISPR-associated protein Cas2
MRRTPAVIAYDISCNKRRRKVYRCLLAWQLDCQYSVFECNLTEFEAEELFIQLTKIIDETEDSLLLAWLSNKHKAKAVTQHASISFLSPVCYVG